MHEQRDTYMRVDLEGLQLLDHTFGLVKREKFRDANAHKGRLVFVRKLTMHFFHGLLHVIHLGKGLLMIHVNAHHA